MKYTEWQYLFPPRPESAISPDTLGFYEGRKWVAQHKMNGTNTIIGISPDKNFIAMTRHGTDHKAWAITDHIKTELTRLFPENEWFVLCAELMHSKGPTIKDTLYIHDCLVWQGEFLLDSTFESRQLLLDQRLITGVETATHYVCDKEGKVWYAKRFNQGFTDLFWAINDTKIVEGLVLKNPQGKLRSCRTATENRYWMVKCRHPNASYNF